jgi:hypothetical protein
MILSEGVIIATLMTMGFTTLMSWLKNKVIKNPKIKYYIPNGFLLALIFGTVSIPVLHHYNLLGEIKEPLWEFLGAWVVIIGLSGFGKIAGQRLIVFVKAFLSDKQTQVAQAEEELKTLKNQVKAKKEKLDFLVERENLK